MARELGLPFFPQPQMVLERIDERLQLRDLRPGSPGPIWVDFDGPSSVDRRAGGRRQLLGRAVGLRPGVPPPRVVDATAGLGADSHLLAALGCQVIAIERSPVVAAVLRDGIARAGTPVELLLGDAIGILAELSTDVVTLDPMFPPGKSALAKKPSQYLQALLGQPADTAELFAAARAAARRRVVVKRPRIGPPLVESPRPSHCHEGKSVRFDVYLAG